MKSNKELEAEMDQEDLESEPARILSDRHKATPQQMAGLFRRLGINREQRAQAKEQEQKEAQAKEAQAALDEEEADIRAEALRRLKVRQFAKGQLAPAKTSSPSQSDTPPKTE